MLQAPLPIDLVEKMQFSQIKIQNLRCIENAELAPGEGVNLVIGRNASGKTSLLEAVYMLGRGNTFRDKRMGTIISQSKNFLAVTGKAASEGKKYQVGIGKSHGKTKVVVNGQKVAKLSVLAKTIPLQLVTPNIQNLFQGESLYRRRVIDWGLFHVEPSFEQLSKRYQRVVAQRNLALKSADRIFSAWDPELIQLGNDIDRMRSNYFSKLTEEARKLGLSITEKNKLEFRWKKGWNDQEALESVTKKNRSSDQSRGFTQAGPHRADFEVRSLNQPLKSSSSRGEQKMIAVGILLAQYRVIAEAINNTPILLLDDLESELDRGNRIEIFTQLEKLNGSQIFITTLNQSLEDEISLSKMFHVEHGVITEVSV